jgi:CheY-like chemotaxis protein
MGPNVALGNAVAIDVRESSESATVPLPTVLVVDDEPDMLENVARILQRGSYVCLTAKSGQSALQVFEREQPDLVLTDLRMTGMDGLALLRAVRRLSPRTPVIIFTAYASDAAAYEATQAGAAAFLAKPFSAAQLLQAIRTALPPLAGNRA